MNGERTKDLSGKKSFEERVFARFDAMDARFDAMDARFDAMDARFDVTDARLESLEARLEKLESRDYDTKPIWERALKAILETRTEVGELNQRVGVLESSYAGITANLEEFKREMIKQLTRRLDLVLKALVDTRDEMALAEERITKLESQLA